MDKNKAANLQDYDLDMAAMRIMLKRRGMTSRVVGEFCNSMFFSIKPAYLYISLMRFEDSIKVFY